MTWQKGFLFSLLIFSSTLVQAAAPAADYEEVSYDDLVNQLNKKKTSVIRNANDPLDDIQLHAGFGLITSANTVNTGRDGDTMKYQNGFQLSLGIDLFSKNWVAETALRNFGQAHSGAETRSLKEFDLKLMYRDMLSGTSGYRLGTGIGNRSLKIEDDANQVSVDDNTPAALFFGGVETFISKSLTLGVEAGFRSAMVNDTADKSGLDLTLRLDTSF